MSADNNSDIEDFVYEYQNEDCEEYQYSSDEIGGEEKKEEENNDKYLDNNSWLNNKMKYQKENISTYKNRWNQKEQEIRQEKLKSNKSKNDSKESINSKGGETSQKGVNSKELFSQSASSSILINDLWIWMQNGYKDGIEVTPNDDDIFTWNVKIHEVNIDSELTTDLSCLDSLYGYGFIELKLQWHMDLHPYFPPFVAVVRPCFEGAMLGKIATLPCLQVSHWDPISSPNDILKIIKKELEKNGRIDLESELNSIENFSEGSYSHLEHLLVKLAIVTDTIPRIHINSQSPMKLSTSSPSFDEGLKEVYPASSEEKKRKIDEVKAYDQSSSTVSEYSVCSYQFKLGDKMWRCRTCRTDETCVMCDNCYKDSNHLGHEVSESIMSLDESGWCDCGDPSSIKPKGFCLQHTGNAYNNQSAKTPIKVASKGIWTKGTGYGSGHKDEKNSSWNVDQHLASQKEKVRLQSDILSEIFVILSEYRTPSSSSSSFNNEMKTFPAISQLFDIVEQSCLVPLIIQYLVSFQLREVEIQSEIYNKIFQILYIFYDLPNLNPLLLTLKDQDLSIQQFIVQNLNPIITHYQKYNKASLLVDTTEIYEMSSVINILDEDEKLRFLFGVCKLISAIHSEEVTMEIIKLNKIDDLLENVKDEEAEYKSSMIDFQFEDVDELSNYHYKTDAKNESSGSNLKERIKRLTKEIVDLNHSLPLSLSSSVFMRVVENRIDTVQFLISGPGGTPYEDGLFIFDAFFPATYPNSPPKVNLQTTGKGQVRFNPNLYNCGKVCLSLLGTWSGNAGETWDVKLSTFLQVLVSIQSLIFVPDPYFNEPGYERSMNTIDGNNKSNSYNENISNMTIKWAMLDQLQNPSNIFRDVINTHFKLKKKKIIKRLTDWNENNKNKITQIITNQDLIALLNLK
jgi:ubiquitin-protein ligase